jgi:sialate O-acetylesterase
MNNLVKQSIFISLLVTLSYCPIKANVWLPGLFTDNMVLQQGKDIVFWGTAKPGEKVTITILEQNVSVKTDKEGKWKIILKPIKGSFTPLEINIKGKNSITLKNVLVGEVWVCSGQSNMDMTVAKEDRYWCGVNNEAEEVASANYPYIRVFDVDFTPSMEIKTDAVGKWEICSPKTVGHFSAAAYFFAREIHKKYTVPVGLITTAYGASTAEAWISEQALKTKPDLNFLLTNYNAKLEKFYADSAVTQSKYRSQLSKWNGDIAAAKAASGDVTASQNTKLPRAPRNADPRVDQHNPYVLYNGMVAPLIPYTICGVLWYQGESNGATADQYAEIMETLITDWRSKWQQGNFPFIYVQLANHQKLITQPVKNDAMVVVRDEQLKNLSVPNTAMVVAIDNADSSSYGNIHPKNKQEIGRRLAIAAEAIAYKEQIEYMGPIYKSMKIEGNSIRITFDHIGSGLVAKGDSLVGFAIAGEDKNWVHGNAIIDGNTVVVTGTEISNPVAVRYAWGKNPPCNLYNKEDLPASPFKTDN